MEAFSSKIMNEVSVLSNVQRNRGKGNWVVGFEPLSRLRLAETKKGVEPYSTPFLNVLYSCLRCYLVSFRITSCAPPSMMLVDDTSVILAFSLSSGIVIAPQLHIVDFTFPRVISRLSLSLPA